MDQIKTGSLIRALRTEAGLTQRELARTLGVTEQAVSKWERGAGCPDVSLLSALARALGVSAECLLSGELDRRERSGGFMQNLRFYVCPQCGALITADGSPALSCCGRSLEALTPRKPDPDHRLILEEVEDEWYVTAPHPMEKGHYLSFLAMVRGARVSVLRCCQ